MGVKKSNVYGGRHLAIGLTDGSVFFRIHREDPPRAVDCETDDPNGVTYVALRTAAIAGQLQFDSVANPTWPAYSALTGQEQATLRALWASYTQV